MKGVAKNLLCHVKKSVVEHKGKSIKEYFIN